MDAHTGTNFFKEYLLCLLGSKAVIYVTHQVEFLPVADLILVIKNVIFCSKQEPMFLCFRITRSCGLSRERNCDRGFHISAEGCFGK